MAIGLKRMTDLVFGGFARPVISGSGQSRGWVTIHSNVADAATGGGYAAETAAVLRRPLSATTAGIIPTKIVHPISRVILRLRYPRGVVISTTHPVVRLYGVFGDLVSGAFPDDGTVQFMRLDAQAGTTAGLTLSALGNASDLNDSTYCYSSPSSLAGMDLQCGQYLMGLVETAGVITTAPNTGAIELQALFQN